MISNLELAAERNVSRTTLENSSRRKCKDFIYSVHQHPSTSTPRLPPTALELWLVTSMLCNPMSWLQNFGKGSRSSSAGPERLHPPLHTVGLALPQGTMRWTLS
jgi:hypothetical protein